MGVTRLDNFEYEFDTIQNKKITKTQYDTNKKYKYDTETRIY